MVGLSGFHGLFYTHEYCQMLLTRTWQLVSMTSFYSYQWSWPTRSVPVGHAGWGEAVWWCPSGPFYWGGSRYRWQPRRGLTGLWWHLALGSSPCLDTASHTASSQAETPSAVRHTQYHMLDKPELSCSIEIRELLPQIMKDINWIRRNHYDLFKWKNVRSMHISKSECISC